RSRRGEPRARRARVADRGDRAKPGLRRARDRRSAAAVARARAHEGVAREARRYPASGGAEAQASLPARASSVGARARLQGPAVGAEGELAHARSRAQGGAGAPLRRCRGPRRVARAVRRVDAKDRRARAPDTRAARRRRPGARAATRLHRGPGDRRARGSPRAARGLSRAGSLLARGDLRSRVRPCGHPRSRGDEPMIGGTWLAVAVLAAIWPFNRGRDDAEPVTIESLESRVVEVDVDAKIPASEDKAIES